MNKDIKIELPIGLEFETSEERYASYKNWLESILKNQPVGAIGGRLTYKLTPTSVGLVCIIEDSITNTSFDLTDYLSW